VDLKFGRFLFDDVTTQTEFERVVRQALVTQDAPQTPAPEKIRVPRRGQKTPYAMSVVAVRRPEDRALLPEGAGCMVFIYDDRANDLPTERLAWLYRLTAAELRICEAIHREGSVETAALSLSLTQHTVRSHLKNVYTKFGVATQGQLMQRLAGSFRLSEGIERPETDSSG
jgi:DNA-binding CsgD family transcriptional regulator